MYTIRKLGPLRAHSSSAGLNALSVSAALLTAGGLFYTNSMQQRTFCSAASLSNVEKGKRLAARAAIDAHVKNGMNIGIGSGSTIVYGIERLAERIKQENLRIKVVPTSFQSEQECIKRGELGRSLYAIECEVQAPILFKHSPICSHGIFRHSSIYLKPNSSFGCHN